MNIKTILVFLISSLCIFGITFGVSAHKEEKMLKQKMFNLVLYDLEMKMQLVEDVKNRNIEESRNIHRFKLQFLELSNLMEISNDLEKEDTRTIYDFYWKVDSINNLIELYSLNRHHMKEEQSLKFQKEYKKLLNEANTFCEQDNKCEKVIKELNKLKN
jgi:hypothetical protein